MKLSDIVRYLNQLDQPECDPDITPAIQHLWGIVDVVANNRVQIGDTREVMAQDVIDLQNHYHKFLATVTGVKDQLREMIRVRQPEMFWQSQQLYEQEMVFETADYILQRRFQHTAEGMIDLQTRIRNYGDWRTPGLIIRPGLETFIEEMVPLDPLYVVDTMPELLDPSVSKFADGYRRRLRIYHINDYRDLAPLHELPDGQFGLIFAYNFLNYKPMGVIERYIADFARKLRPGGHAVFTYNECDRAQGVGLAENHFMCYTPGSMIRDLVAKHGLELDYNQHDQYDLAWMDVRRPGDLVSRRGAQVLAKIMPK